MATLPTGQISLSEIQDYYGGSNPIALSEYYAETYQIPASGQISLDDFRGGASYYGDRMVTGGGGVSDGFTLTISTTSSASLFSFSGSYPNHVGYQKGASNGTIALFGDDFRSSTDDTTNGSDIVYYISFSSPSTSHGYGANGPTGFVALGEGASNSVSVLWGGGAINAGGTTFYTGALYRQTISTSSSASSTGGVTGVAASSDNSDKPNGTLSNGTTAVFTGHRVSSSFYQLDMTYVTITSNSNAAYYGQLGIDSGDGTQERSGIGCADARSRGLIAGGDTIGGTTDRIDYITVSTTGNSTNFGNLTAHVEDLSAGGNGNRCVFAGGNNGTSNVATASYVNPDTTGNATNWGNLPSAQRGAGYACGHV